MNIDSRTSNTPSTPTAAECCSPMCFRNIDSPVEMVSDTKSKKPKARMKPSDRNRVRIQPRIPTEDRASLFQICCSRVWSADSTVVAPINRVTALTAVATKPCVCCECLIASSNIFATEGPNKALNCTPICEYAAVAPTIQPEVVRTITNSGASENAQKKASEAPLVVALSETQLRAAHFARTTDCVRRFSMVVQRSPRL